MAGLALLGALASVLPASAQERIDTYPAAYFAANQPATAYDMVVLLPGFRIQLGDATVRGFAGTVANVLIDGQLATSKEDTAEILLRRIPAAAVQRIELIRGAADMHGYALMANVVRAKSAALQGRAEVEGIVTHYGTTAPKLALHLVRQGESSTLELSAAWARDFGLQNQNGFGSRARYLPNGSPLLLSRYNFPKQTNSAELSSAYRQPLWDGDLSLGLVVKQDRAYSPVSEDIYFPAVSHASGIESARTRNGEGQFDYQHGLGGYGQVELFAVHRLTEQDEISQTSTAAGTDRSRSRYNQREDVARLAWHYDGPVKLEAGAEGTINVLNSRSTLTLSGAPVVLPAANIRLEEKRLELFSTASWRLAPVLISELGLRYETSTLTQSGDSSLVKDLAFLKPRWLTSYTPAPGHELRFLVERQVGQLVFRDFASSTSLNSNIITGGNKNLEPARAWNVSLAWERHFWKRGSLVVEARREFISDVVDRIPVVNPNGRVFNAVGNIGYGTRDDLQVNMILPFDELGLKGLTLKVDATARQSKVRDPATGQYRRIVGGQTFGTTPFVFTTMDELTYDIPDQNLQLGVTWHNHMSTQEYEYRIDEITTSWHSFKLGLFAEYKPTPAWTVRLFARDIAQTSAFRDREVYSGLRGSAALAFLERRSLNNGTMLGVNIQHDF